MITSLPILTHELRHLFLTFLIVFIITRKYRDFRLILVSIFMGFFIDIDHFFDYFYWTKGYFSLTQFFDPSLYVHGTGKVFVFLHGWEYLFLLYFIGKKYSKKIPGLVYALTLPYLGHLLIDQFSSTRNTFGYFFICRLINNFSLTAFNGH